MTDPLIAVVGSIVRDRICRVDALPMPGETVVTSDVVYALGGKGANQAFTAARLGPPTFLLARVGDDATGRDAAGALATPSLTPVLLSTPGAASGEATVLVDEGGENLIVVDLGANLRLDAADVEAHRETLAKARVLVTQLEVSDGAVRAVADLGEETEETTILNAAPLREGTPDLMRGFDVAVVNRAEAEVLAGVGVATVEDAFAAVRAMREFGVRHPIVTLGAAGAAYFVDGRVLHARAPKVDVVDTTGAGDAFVGALAAFLAARADFEEAVTRACRVAALAATRLGARAGCPDRDALDAFERERDLGMLG